MIRLEHVYLLAGLMFAGFAVLSVRDRSHPRRLRNGLFWALFALSFLAGGRIGDLGNGMLAIGLAGVAAIGLGRGAGPSTSPEQRSQAAARRGNALFLPALIVPAVALLGALALKNAAFGGVALLETRQATLISLALGAVGALLVACFWLRPPLLAPLQEGRSIMDQVGWAAVLPQMLASLGAVFALAGVGRAVGDLTSGVIPADSRMAAVCAYTVGMALFTAVMGNAFAAFPVMTAGIGLPLIVQRFGGDPAAMGALGMLSGFCGTLLTPMAANFNIVPVALLGLPDRFAVIRAQAPTAFVLLVANTVLMYLLVFHR